MISLTRRISEGEPYHAPRRVGRYKKNTFFASWTSWLMPCIKWLFGVFVSKRKSNHQIPQIPQAEKLWPPLRASIWWSWTDLVGQQMYSSKSSYSYYSDWVSIGIMNKCVIEWHADGVLGVCARSSHVYRSLKLPFFTHNVFWGAFDAGIELSCTFPGSYEWNTPCCADKMSQPIVQL